MQKSRKKFRQATGRELSGGVVGKSFNRRTSLQKEGEKYREGISLERVLQSSKAFELFWKFANVKHVSEQLRFWIEVERFQNSDWKAFKVLGIEQNSSEEGVSPKLEAKKSAMRRSSFSRETRQRPLERAEKLWKTYLADDSKMEVCVPSVMKSTLRATLDTATSTVDITIFREMQRWAFRDMEKGLFPRFMKSLDHIQLSELVHYLNVSGSSRAEKYVESIGANSDFLQRDGNNPQMATINAMSVDLSNGEAKESKEEKE